MISWCTADYVILAVSAAAGVAGLFVGFSGATAFLAATMASSLAGRLAWMRLADRFATNWTRGLTVFVIALLVFGLVRWLVRKVVNGLLRQPADSLFGFLVASVTGLALATVAVYTVNYLQLAEVGSVLVSEVSDWAGR